MEKKRNLADSGLCYVFVALTWGGTVWLLWFFQEQVYGGSIETAWLQWTVTPVAWFLGAYLGGHLQLESDEETKARRESRPEGQKHLLRILLDLIILFFLLYLIWNLLADGIYDLPSYQKVTLFSVLAMLHFFPRMGGAWLQERPTAKNLAWPTVAMFALAALTTLLYFALTRPVTVPQGRRLVEEAGYTEVFYARAVDHGVIADHIFPGSREKMTEEEFRQGYYLFQGRRDGQDWGVLVSLYRPHIVEQVRLKDNGELRFFLAQRENQS